MKKILAEVKKESDKSFLLYKVTPLGTDDFGVIDPFGEFPYELKSEEEINQFLMARLNAVGHKVENNDIEIKYYI